MTWQDYASNRAITVLRSAFDNADDTGETRVLARLGVGQAATAADVKPAIDYVASGSDGADFRLIALAHIAGSYGDSLPPDAREAIKAALLGARYWMDEPGMTPMVYWSENHQVLFSVSELVAGQMFPDDVFADGRTGTSHAESARTRLAFWLEQRWKFGFSEWNSHYDVYDAAALAVLIDCSDDPTLARKAEIILDLLFVDIATQTFRGEFITASGRLYAANRKTGDAGVRRLVRYLLGDIAGLQDDAGIEINVLLSRYRLPPVLTEIARDQSQVTIKASFGRDPRDIENDKSLDTREKRIMALWGMEAFTDPDAIAESMAYIRERGLLATPFLAPFRQLNYRLLAWSNLLPVVSRVLDLPSNGTVLGKAEVYTLRTPNFTMYTAEAYRPRGYGNQQHVFGMTFGPEVTLFHSHPAIRDGDAPPNGNSPGYWTGYGTLPLSCQQGPINVSL